MCLEHDPNRPCRREAESPADEAGNEQVGRENTSSTLSSPPHASPSGLVPEEREEDCEDCAAQEPQRGAPPVQSSEPMVLVGGGEVDGRRSLNLTQLSYAEFEEMESQIEEEADRRLRIVFLNLPTLLKISTPRNAEISIALPAVISVRFPEGLRNIRELEFKLRAIGNGLTLEALMDARRATFSVGARVGFNGDIFGRMGFNSRQRVCEQPNGSALRGELEDAIEKLSSSVGDFRREICNVREDSRFSEAIRLIVDGTSIIAAMYKIYSLYDRARGGCESVPRYQGYFEAGANIQNPRQSMRFMAGFEVHFGADPGHSPQREVDDGE